MGLFDKKKNNQDLQKENHKGSGFKIPQGDDNYDAEELQKNIDFEKKLIEQKIYNIGKLREKTKLYEKYPKQVAALALIIEKEQRGLDDSRVLLNYLQGELEEELAKQK